MSDLNWKYAKNTFLAATDQQRGRMLRIGAGSKRGRESVAERPGWCFCFKKISRKGAKTQRAPNVK